MPEVTIERLGHHGDGFSPGPVFVPLTLPGEVVMGEVNGDRIDAPKIVTPSEHRVKPPCSHFKRCGGCSLQHASDSFVMGWKADIVREALAAQGLGAPIRNVHTSPTRSRRRATFAGKRTKSGAMIGFHVRRSDEVVDVTTCSVLMPELLALRPAMVEITRFGGSRKSTINISVTWSDAGADVSVSNAKDLDRKLMSDALPLLETYELARLTWNGELVAERVPPIQHFGNIAARPPSGAFLQATKEGENSLIESVLETVSGSKVVLDLFSGCGTFSLPTAKLAEVHAVETSTEMLLALDQAWRMGSGLKKVTTEARDLFRRPLVPQELNQFDTAIIDPPRAGAEAQTREIAQSNIGKIAMVSCNPVTFARDAKTLRDAGFSLNWVDIVDQFRWSPHIELAASFTR